MKRILSFLLLLSFTLSFSQVRVRGYYRKNGTYVAPHIRSNPDGYKYNNYNYNNSTSTYSTSTYLYSTDYQSIHSENNEPKLKWYWWVIIVTGSAILGVSLGKSMSY